MKKMKWIRPLAICLAMICLLSTVSALSVDLDGDGKTDIWDLQLAITGNKSGEEIAGILKAVLNGKGDELRPNANGQYEIWSIRGIYNLRNNATKGMDFILMADIDLSGMQWKPLLFSGNFDGNGHTISNVTICEDYYNGSSYAMGLFATIHEYTKGGQKVQSHVKNLHVENVNLTATENSQYMGLLAGTNRGIVENCTATGTVTDNRTQLAKSVYVGALVGCNENSTPAGRVEKGADLLTATAGSGKAADKVEGVSAKMATFYAAESSKRYTGIIGFSKAANMSSDMIWQDTSNSTRYQAQAEQTRRQKVSDTMVEMGTVQWTPSETITFTRFDNPSLSHSNAYVAGRTYTGIPYVGAQMGNYGRFLSQMQASKDDQGRYVTVTGLKDGTQSTSYQYGGFVQMMGNNCSWAVSWAWASVSPSRVANNDGAVYGGVMGGGVDRLVPTSANTTSYGVLAVGGYAVADGQMDTRQIITENGTQQIAESFAKSSMGDAMVYNDDTDGAHARLIGRNPVIIRKGEALTGGATTTNTIDLELSYVMVHEQGDGLSDNRKADGTYDQYTVEGKTYNIKYTSWRLDHKYTLGVLLTESGYTASKNAGERPGSGWGYIPITMRAFDGDSGFETSKKPYYTQPGSNPVVLPNSGEFYTNYWTEYGKLVITDANGVEVYNKTSYTTTKFTTLVMSELFPDADDNLVAGQTYYATLQFKASNGTVTTVKSGEAFTY